MITFIFKKDMISICIAFNLTLCHNIKDKQMISVMFLVSTGGIYLAYLIMSLISEKLYSFPYQSMSDPNKKDMFQYPILTVWLGCLLCSIFGKIKSIANHQEPNPIPFKEQFILGFLYTLNFSFTNISLIYLSYPIQVLGRNSRLLLVIIVGIFFSRVHHHHKHLKLRHSKLVVGILITIGVIVFSFFKDSKKQSQSKPIQKEWIGYVCLLISVTADALFSDSQAYSKANFHPTSNHLFISANFFTFVFCFLYSLASGQLLDQIKFCLDHSEVKTHLLLIGGLQIIGQVSIYYVIANYKQHVFPLISTVRKFLTFFLSIFIFGHSVNNSQWLAIALIFGGIIFQFFDEKKEAQQKMRLLSQQKPTESQSSDQGQQIFSKQDKVK